MNDSGARHAVAPDDLYRLKLLEGAQLAPDGTHVVYAVAQMERPKDAAADDPAAQSGTAALWVMALDTGKSRQITSGRARDWFAQWSPDGSQIAFLSTRDDKPQLYVIAVDGGEARPLTSLKQGVGGSFAWSPDGRQLAFSAGPDEEPPDLTKPYRLTRHTYRFDAIGYLDRIVHDIWVVDVAGGEPRQLTHDGAHNTLPQWSPDGAELLFTTTLFPDEFRLYPSLRIVTLEGEVRDLVHKWGMALAAAWLPDGKQVVFAGVSCDLPIGSKADLWLIDRQGGTPICRSAGLTVGVSGSLQSDMAALTDIAGAPRILVTPDGTAAFVQVQDGGKIQLYRIALTGPEACKPVVMGERSCFPLSMVGSQLLFAASSLANPADLYLSELDGRDERRLTTLNAALLDELDLPSVEHLRFAGTDDEAVEGWVLTPTSGAPPYPTILYIHGGPHSGFGHIFSFDFQMLAGAGYAVLFVNQRGSTGYGSAFATRIIGDWGNLDYADLMAGVDAAVERGIADPERLGCCGLSGGGNLSCWIVGQTRRFKAAVPENPVTNWVSFYGVSDIGPWFAVQELGGKPHEIPEVYRRCSPITYAHTCTTPTLLIQGEADYRCPAEQSEQFYNVLKANGCTVEMVRLPGGAHAASIRGDLAIRRAQNDALLDWLKRYV